MEIRRFEAADTEQVAKTYAEVFAGPPWNEYTRCSEENPLSFYGRGIKPGQRCLRISCPGTLVLAYPLDYTTDYVLKETGKPDAIAKVLEADGQVIGFTWGYTYPEPKMFARSKYTTAAGRRLAQEVVSKAGLGDKFFYLSECGIREEYRGQGFSNLLVAEILSEVSKSGLWALMRTNQESPMVAVAEKFGMSQILGPKVSVDRIRRKNLISEDPVYGWDRENSSRVLFVLKNTA